MGKLLLLSERIRDAVIQSLGGFTNLQMQSALQKANDIGDLAMTGKYNHAHKGVHDALRVGVQVRQLRYLTALLFPEYAERKGYVYIRRREFGIPKVEIIHRERERKPVVATCEIINETRTCGVLGKDS